jgi:hypothetical protein
MRGILQNGRLGTLYSSCLLSFDLKLISSKCKIPEAQNSLRIIKDQLIKSYQNIAAEATITVAAGDGAALAIKISCTLKNKMHDYVVRRSITNAITMQKWYWIKDGKIKLKTVGADTVRQFYLAPPASDRDGRLLWLNHSLLVSEAIEMPIEKFAEQLKLTVQKEEARFLACTTSEQFKNDAKSKQLLLYSISSVLSMKFRDVASGPKRVSHDMNGTQEVVGTVTVAVPPILQTDSQSTTTRHKMGAVHPNLADTAATPQMGREASETIPCSESETTNLPDAALPKRRLDYRDSNDIAHAPSPSLSVDSRVVITRTAEEHCQTGIKATRDPGPVFLRLT